MASTRSHRKYINVFRSIQIHGFREKILSLIWTLYAMTPLPRVY